MKEGEPAGHRFNDDIAFTERDIEFLTKQFPEIVHVLVNPELRAEFAKHEEVANDSKAKVHRLGLFAVGCAAFALMAAATKPVLHFMSGSSGTLEDVLAGAEGLALLAAAIAMWGVAIGKHKVKWLEARMMTEILRAWHFQFLIYKGNEIERSCSGEAERSEFLKQRNLELEAFLHKWNGKTDSYYHNLIENAEVQYVPLHDPSSAYPPGSKTRDNVFRTYKMLRFQHQLDYATYKLKNTTDKQPWQILKWPTRVLHDRTTAWARFCVWLSLLGSVGVIAFHFGGNHDVPAILSIVITGLLVLNVAARTIQDGLASPKELERYKDYQQKTRYLLNEFEHVKTLDEKSSSMRDMERVAIEELRSFLRANEEGRFVM